MYSRYLQITIWHVSLNLTTNLPPHNQTTTVANLHLMSIRFFFSHNEDLKTKSLLINWVHESDCFSHFTE